MATPRPSSVAHRIATTSPFDRHRLVETMAVIARSRELLEITRGVSTRLYDGPRHRAASALVDVLHRGPG